MSEEDDSRPYIEPPDEKDDDTRNGLMCFIDGDRECGADCMAWVTFPSESPYLSEQGKNCAVLVGVERLGRYSGGIMKTLKNTKEDTARDQQQAPSDPMGSKR
jgi:hypothetical protein